MPIRDKDMEKNETHLADTNLNIERLSEYSSDSAIKKLYIKRNWDIFKLESLN